MTALPLALEPRILQGCAAGLTGAGTYTLGAHGDMEPPTAAAKTPGGLFYELRGTGPCRIFFTMGLGGSCEQWEPQYVVVANSDMGHSP